MKNDVQKVFGLNSLDFNIDDDKDENLIFITKE